MLKKEMMVRTYMRSDRVILGLHFHLLIYCVLVSLFGNILYKESRKTACFDPSSVRKAVVKFQLNLRRQENSGETILE